ncbi:MAG: SusC/RagA family TonB-linked outer membrane protein, partial [Saprospiraceae bacterium]
YFQWDNPLSVANPVAAIELANREGEGYRLLNNLELEYKMPFLDGLSLKSNISYDYRAGEFSNFTSPEVSFGAGRVNNGFLRTEEEVKTSTLIETYGTYRKELGNSKFDVTVGHAYQDFILDKDGVQGEFLERADNEFGFSIPTEELKPDSVFLENRLISFFARVNYSLADKYLLTLSMRRDGSTRFGPANRWGYFPSAAFAWRVLQEDFASGLRNTFSDLKVRLGYGLTGTESIDDYLYTTFYSYGTGDAAYQFGDEYVNTLRAVGVDPDIKWESTRSLNIGLDFGFFNNRLTGTLDVYRKTTTDLLARVAAGAFTNLSDQIVTNIAEMENEGIELALNSYVIDRELFDWEVGFTAAYNRNEITKLDNSNLPEFGGYETGGISGDVGQTIQILKVGEPINSFRTYKHKRDENGNPVIGANDLERYEDINQDGQINEEDLVVGESPDPDFILGLTNTITYGNFDLAFTLRANIGNYVYNNAASATGYFDHLTVSEVTNNVHESAFINNFKERQLKSDIYVENGSFLKLDNVSLGYTFNKFKFMRSLRIYTTVQNAFVVTGYSGIDPEAALNSQGIDNNVYPFSLTYLFGINASF